MTEANRPGKLSRTKQLFAEWY